MLKRKITTEQINAFSEYLKGEERADGTTQKYLHDIHHLAVWMNGDEVTKEASTRWKEHLQMKEYAPATVNSMLAAVNSFFRFIGWDDCRVKLLRVQHQLFRDQAKELNRDEYKQLISTAYAYGRERLALLMETICATGIRVSEVKYITVEAAKKGRAQICLKGKIRTILIPTKLCRKLIKYAKSQKRLSNEIFLTKTGNSLSRKQIWAEMKDICRKAGITPSKVFPHNLRHLFARTFYNATRDVAKLADVLGHSSIETTRIYLLSTGAEHARQLEHLGLIS